MDTEGREPEPLSCHLWLNIPHRTIKLIGRLSLLDGDDKDSGLGVKSLLKETW